MNYPRVFSRKVFLFFLFMVCFSAGPLALFCGAAAAGATYYVSTTGSDANLGTQARPFQTIQKAANTVTAGDTVVVADGTYAAGANCPSAFGGATYCGI